MARGEASIVAALDAPAGTFASDLAGGVHAKTADGDENMLTRLHPDGDEAALAGLAVVGELLAGQAAVQQSCLHKDVRSAAAAVISAVFDVAMAAAKHIGLVLEGIGGINGQRQGGQRRRAGLQPAGRRPELRLGQRSSGPIQRRWPAAVRCRRPKPGRWPVPERKQPVPEGRRSSRRQSNHSERSRR